MIEVTADERRAPAGWWEPPPFSLAYFVPILDAASKDWRRGQRPRLRAERPNRRRGPRHDRKGNTDE